VLVEDSGTLGDTGSVTTDSLQWRWPKKHGWPCVCIVRLFSIRIPLAHSDRFGRVGYPSNLHQEALFFVGAAGMLVSSRVLVLVTLPWKCTPVMYELAPRAGPRTRTIMPPESDVPSAVCAGRSLPPTLDRCTSIHPKRPNHSRPTIPLPCENTPPDRDFCNRTYGSVS
jgi:hypothetical protein